jgi:hypothetical protein
MMVMANDQVVFYSFVEDNPTRAVVLRLFSYLGQECQQEILLAPGHPVVTHGFGKLKEKAIRLRDASKAGIKCFFLTDLDKYETPNELGMNWFGIQCLSELPPHFIFRVSIREIESWIMADREGFAKFMSIQTSCIPENTDLIPDPKQFLFNLIRQKCRKKKYKDMLPLTGQHVGIAYNSMLVAFVESKWSMERAMEHSPSLNRSVKKSVAAMKNV